MVVVSDTSPLIALEYLDDMEVLPRILPGRVFVPPAVLVELSGRVLPPWIEGRKLAQPMGPRILQASLGAGESEAISLALEQNADYLVIDDKAARRLAVALRLNVIGTLGLLVKAKHAGLFAMIRPKLDALRTLPFHIAPALYDDILASIDEAGSTS